MKINKHYMLYGAASRIVIKHHLSCNKFIYLIIHKNYKKIENIIKNIKNIKKHKKQHTL